MRSRDIWQEIAPQAGIEVVHRGLAVAVRRPEAEAVLQAFLGTEMGQGCEMLTRPAALERVPHLRDSTRAVLWSPHEMRVESRTAIPRLAAWLEARWGVRILRSTMVTAIAPPSLSTTAGPVRAERVVVCPGDEFLALYPGRIAAYGLRRCALQMLRVAPATPVRLGASVMGDLSLVFYKGYSELPEAAALRALLEREQAAHLREGVHLIAVQSADGSLVIGDSHDYGPTPGPFGRQAVDQLILDELDAVLALPPLTIAERWIGVYASSPERLMLVDTPEPGVRIVVVTSGTGASTAFGIAEEVMADLLS
jgi:FAD dependent oxidoreductase TIGR03364